MKVKELIELLQKLDQNIDIDIVVKSKHSDDYRAEIDPEISLWISNPDGGECERYGEGENVGDIFYGIEEY